MYLPNCDFSRYLQSFLIYRNTIFYTCFVKFSWDAIAPILQEP